MRTAQKKTQFSWLSEPPKAKRKTKKRKSTGMRGTETIAADGLGKPKRKKKRSTGVKAKTAKKVTKKRTSLRGTDAPAAPALGRGKAKTTKGKAAQSKFGMMQGAVLRKAYKLGQAGKPLPTAKTLYKEVAADLY